VFTGAATAATRAFRIGGAALPAGLALFWGLGEFARGHVLTGFPWNLTATAWLASDAIAQNAAWFGAYGFSALSVFVFALPASLARASWRGPVAALALVALAWMAGAWRLPAGDVALLPDIRLRIVQPAVPQALKWDPEARERNLEELIALTRSAGFDSRTHVIWSETATAFPVWGDLPVLAARRAQVAAAVPPGGILVTGAPRFARDAAGDIQVWNSLHAIEANGEIDATYDKFHLVPFGEYVPLREILPIDRVVPGGMDFSAGPGPQTLAIRGLPPASPLICYEIIFPGRVVEPGVRPGVLVNVTNDSWFGDSAGPYQHFASARMRAIEEGLPLIRAAGGGISAVLDPFGRPVAFLGLGKRGFIDAGLPEAAAPTVAGRFGDFPFAVLLVFFAAIAWRLRPRDR
jgi:apolipoprotein N-acyltransferase